MHVLKEMLLLWIFNTFQVKITNFILQYFVIHCYNCYKLFNLTPKQLQQTIFSRFTIFCFLSGFLCISVQE